MPDCHWCQYSDLVGTDRAPLGGTPWQGALLTVRFLTELALLAVLAVVVSRTHGSLAVRIPLAAARRCGGGDYLGAVDRAAGPAQAA